MTLEKDDSNELREDNPSVDLDPTLSEFITDYNDHYVMDGLSMCR